VRLGLVEYLAGVSHVDATKALARLAIFSPEDEVRKAAVQTGRLPDLTVHIDVTYLRQDFSVLQPVADANPWPEMQRFDFLVRTRTLTEDEARSYREKFDQREPGRPSAYQRVALAALREMTGKDAEPTPEARQVRRTPSTRDLRSAFVLFSVACLRSMLPLSADESPECKRCCVLQPFTTADRGSEGNLEGVEM
jgi:hypothetical protein